MANISVKYEALPSEGQWIRTLSIDPSSTPDQIKCTMKPCRLEDKHSCLSYTWGAWKPASFPIQVNGRTILVRENLLLFLKEGHRNDALVNVPLWIDAICINQDDLAEKSKQVAQMGDVYAQASRVIVWLGAGDDQVINALQHVQAYVASPFVDPEQETVQINSNDKNMAQFDHSGIPLRTYWDNFDAITNLAYWKRMWIVQELLSGTESEIWYGEQRTSWWDLDEYNGFIQDHTGPEGCAHNLGFNKVNKSSCGWLLHRLALKESVPAMSTILPFSITLAQLQQDCYDKRDIVFGGRSLDQDLRHIPVDYRIDAHELLPALFDSPAVKTDHVHVGLLIIDKLGLDIAKSIKMTYDHLPNHTWPVHTIDIGLVVRNTREEHEEISEIDWSAFAYRGRLDRTSQFDDGSGSAVYSSHSGVESLKGPDLLPGDLVCHIAMVHLLFVFRSTDPTVSDLGPVASRQGSATYLDFNTAGEVVTKYEFQTCFETLPKASDGQRPKFKSEFLNTRITHNDKTNDLMAELKQCHIQLNPSSYSLMFTWRALLRVWELKEQGLVFFKPKMAELVGTWEEEETKLKKQTVGV